VLIALLAVLGVDLIVIVVVLAADLGRRRWVSSRPGTFRGVVRVVDGEVDHLGTRSRRGYGRWVRDVLVWTPTPLCLRTALTPIDQLESTRKTTDKVWRLGDNPRVITLAAPVVRVEITVQERDVYLVIARFADTPPVTAVIGIPETETSRPET